MTAYLELSAEYWKQVLKPEDHEHGVGEDRSRCINCRLDGLAEKMSEFETACHNWYFENVKPFALTAGLVADLARSEGLTPAVFRIFVCALNAVHAAADKIAYERATEKN